MRVGPGLAPVDAHPVAWAWTHQAAGALRSRRLGRILRAYRAATGLTQEQLATRLGYDKTYVSMIETGRRSVHDVPALRRIARMLAIPPHLLGVTDDQDSEHAAMVAFAQAVIRLADTARAAGRAADAVSELWPLAVRLEARAALHPEPDILGMLGQAQVSLGVTLGTILPEERMAAASAWTGRGVTAAEHSGDQAALAEALAMHGNELRKGGRPEAVTVLQRAAVTAVTEPRRGAALALLARAAATAGDASGFSSAISSCRDLLQAHGPAGPLLHPFALREIQIRGLLDLGDRAAAAALPSSASPRPAPSPQWETIERITTADALVAFADCHHSRMLLQAAVSAAASQQMPHQIQRAIRIARTQGYPDLCHHAHAQLAIALCQTERIAAQAAHDRPVQPLSAD